MLARQIKDLSIAREALSRQIDTATYINRIDMILERLTDQLEEETKPQPVHRTPVNLDDEIPF